VRLEAQRQNFLKREPKTTRNFGRQKFERVLNMPIYEYLCLKCNKPFSFLVGVVADSGAPECTRCGGKKLRKLISRVARVRSKESSLEDLADPSKLGDMDDPKAMARWAKEMGKSMADETGEELPEDFDEMMERGPGEEADDE
jgi:putative FmdB family regulatory protein